MIERERRWSNMRGAIALLLGAVGAAAAAAPAGPPQLHCASFAAMDAVTLSWTPPADPDGTFLEYALWVASDRNGPYNLAATEALLATNTTTLNGTGANTGPRYFYITTRSNPAVESVSSDTIATLFLQVGQSSPLGQAALDWTLPWQEPVSGAVQAVEMEYPAGVFTSMAGPDPATSFYLYPVSVCEDSLHFRVAHQHPAGCTSYSNWAGDLYRDVTPPSVPLPAAVSVDTTTGRTQVTWYPSPELDTDGYIVIFNNGSSDILLDTVASRLDTTYLWAGGDPSIGPEGLRIAAFDSCWTGVPPSPNTSAAGVVHTTMFLQAVADRCTRRVAIQWTAYAGWAVETHSVYMQVDGTAPRLIAAGTGNGSAHVQLVDPGSTYCFLIRADGASSEQWSLSNRSCVVMDPPPVPAWNYLTTATVVNDAYVRVEDLPDPLAPVGQYILERSQNGEPYTEVARLPGTPAGPWTYEDHDADVHARSYQYRVQTFDSCGTAAAVSNMATTIHLEVEPRLDGVNAVRWNGYVQWAGAVQGYRLFRSTSAGGEVELAYLAADRWWYEDAVRGPAISDGHYCYRVVAEGSGGAFGGAAYSESNKACVQQEGALWIPNAFTPGGFNPIFKPVISEMQVVAYELKIFNRWGQNIWTSIDPAIGWDGATEGRIAPQGIYAYMCLIRLASGATIERNGTVLLLDMHQ